MSKLNKEQLERNPSLFVEKMIKEYVASSPGNWLAAFNNEPIFDEPLVGFADGNDPIFQYYQVLIGDFYLTPSKILTTHLQNIGRDPKQHRKVSVISFVLPITEATRLSMSARSSTVPSLRWNHTRHLGQDFVNELSNFVVSILEKLGYQAVVPQLAKFYQRMTLPNDLLSTNWSQRHTAYAAGLGTFSLNDGLITPRGIAIRCSSVVSDAPLVRSPRIYRNHLANCLFYRNVSCARCIERCPANAITKQGHDKKKCQDFIFNKHKALLEEFGVEKGYILGEYLACGFCQTKVPCEAGIPASA